MINEAQVRIYWVDNRSTDRTHSTLGHSLTFHYRNSETHVSRLGLE